MYLNLMIATKIDEMHSKRSITTYLVSCLSFLNIKNAIHVHHLVVLAYYATAE
jgi:hypothetical protein